MENKIDTQGMSSSGKMNFTRESHTKQPFVPSQCPVFTDMERKELKEIITETLNEWSANK